MKAALVIVDMLNDFVTGSLPVKDANIIIPGIAELCEYELLQPVFACDSHLKNDPEFKDWPAHAVKRTKGARVVDDLAEYADFGWSYPKKSFSLFSNEEVDPELKEDNIDTLFITGVATEYCVRETTLDALKLGYKVYVVFDLIRPVDIEAGNIAVVEMLQAGAKLIPVDSVYDLVKGTK
jgi:nicotinamidase-related amidase